MFKPNASGSGHSLELQTIDALRQGRWRDALELSDRLCRSRPFDNPSHLTLFAVAALRCGYLDAAREPIRRAVACGPNHLPAARLALDLLDGEARFGCAKFVFGHDDSDDLILKAASLLQSDGDDPVTEILSVGGSLVLRVATYSPGDIVRMAPSWNSGAIRHRSIDGRDIEVNEWRMVRPSGPAHLELTATSAGGRTSSCVLVAALDPSHRFPFVDQGERLPARRVLNVVVPIYGDPAATAACLRSLRRQKVSSFVPNIILINDKSPDDRVTALLKAYRQHPNFTIIENEHNLGFAGAINKGLAHCLRGDVLLLNADTVLPPNTLERLLETADANPTAGTLTPFSNNGQYLSFPETFSENPFPDPSQLDEVSEASWKANYTAVFPVPSGIGFCLYIRQECMMACGNLGEQFWKGYYEDVDLCLRIEALGFENVCATGVYVAHRGSRSFRDSKAYLAARNRSILDKHHPRFSQRAAAWLMEDPLRPFRARIETCLSPSHRPTTLLLAADEASRERARALAQDISRSDRTLIAFITEVGGNRSLAFISQDGVPKNFTLPLHSFDRRDVSDLVKRESIVKTIILDPAAVELPLLSALGSKTSIIVHEGDAGIFCPRRSLLAADGAYCGAPDQPSVCDRCVRSSGCASPSALVEGVAEWRRAWAKLIFSDSRVQRANYFRRFNGITKRTEKATAAVLVSDLRQSPRLAIVPLFNAACDKKFLEQLCGQVAARSTISMIVFGDAFVTSDMHALPNVIGIGAAGTEEINTLFHIHGITHTIIGSRGFSPGHPCFRALRGSGRPLASFRYPFESGLEVAADDLYIDVAEPIPLVAERVLDWIASTFNQADDVSKWVS